MELNPNLIKAAPPLLEEDRTTKKARFREQGSDENNPPVMSFRDSLMKDQSRATVMNECVDDIDIVDEDVIIEIDGCIPSVVFSQKMQEQLVRPWKNKVIVKLLGRSIGYRSLCTKLESLWRVEQGFTVIDLENDYYLVRFGAEEDVEFALTQGPWTIFGHYLTVQKWSPSFDCLSDKIEIVVPWIRLPGMPLHYYHKRVLRILGEVVGRVIRIDYNIEVAKRGKFTRVAVEICLNKPLVSQFQLNGKIQRIEYQGLPTICFKCGKYGHTVDTCQSKQEVPRGQGCDGVYQPEGEATVDPATVDNPKNSLFGPWMIVAKKENNRNNPLGEPPDNMGWNGIGGDKDSEGSTYVARGGTDESRDDSESGGSLEEETDMELELQAHTLRALALEFLRTFKALIQKYNPSMVALFEPRISGKKTDEFIIRSGFERSHRIEAEGFSGVKFERASRQASGAKPFRFLESWLIDGRFKTFVSETRRGSGDYVNSAGHFITEEEILWYQKSRRDWIEFGDRNTKYFHRQTIQRRRQNQIAMLKDEHDNWIEDVDIIKAHAVTFFKNLYTKELGEHIPYPLVSMFPRVDEMNLGKLNAEVCEDDIREAIFSMHPLKAPGIDGLHTVFYQTQWDTVGVLVCNLVQGIFKGQRIPSEINKTLIVLIPKVEHPDSLRLYRPISLCPIIYKIITKIVVNILKGILLELIGPMQTSFVPGRHITENIIIAQEVIHTMRRKSRKIGQMLIKVDLEKAYDRLSWDFIFETLCEAGIPSDLIRITMDCITSASIQILWNGECTEEFVPSRGIRQGDHISLYIFVLCIERLNHGIHRAVNTGTWRPIRLSKRSTLITHVFFTKASCTQAAVINDVLNTFCMSSGAKVNKQKSQVFFSKNVKPCNVRNIGTTLRFSVTTDLGNYLGGLGLKNLTLMNEALLMKLGWGLLVNRNSYWAQDAWVADVGPLVHLAVAPIPEAILHVWVADAISVDAIKPLSPGSKADQFYWGSSNSGMFTARTTYNPLLGNFVQDEEVRWKSIWKWRGPHKIRTFLWLAAKERIKCKAELYRRHIGVDMICMCCGYAVEDTAHALRDCATSRRIWNMLLTGRETASFFTLPTRDWIFANIQGGLIRDATGRWHGGFCMNIGICSVTIAELWGLYQGLILAWQMGIRLLVVEIDSLCVTQLLNRKSLNATLPLVNDILGLLSRDWQVSVHHVYREANFAADFMASHALTLPLGLHYFTTPPLGRQDLASE
ncbi:reverse transcriptase domain-containing protein [Citrus sinensis]|nr:reverse transcriptase domain-containing protein [Citrus sinensis]